MQQQQQDAASPAVGGWASIDARLPPLTHLPLDNICYHESPTHAYLVATNAHQQHYTFLKLVKDNDRLESYLDPSTYTKHEIDQLLSSLKAGGKILTSGRAKAILGFIRFTQGYYLVLVTRRRLVARIGPHKIYEARGTVTLSLCEREDKRSFFSRRGDEEVYHEQFSTFDTSQYFYYSHSYDLTNTLQTNMTTPVRADGAVLLRAKFLWNEYLLRPTNQLVPVGEEETASAPGSPAPAPAAAVAAAAPPPPQEEPSAASPSAAAAFSSPSEHELLLNVMNDWTGWVVRAIRGCVAQSPLECSTGAVLLTIIGRTSKKFAGVRYLRRGINDDGHVANYVEVEQIVSDTASLVEIETKGLFSSYVQVRGSVPIHWHHPMVQRPKPPIKLGFCDPKYPATQKHFAEIVEDLGAPVIVVNLLKSHEKKTREGVLTTEYVKALKTISRGICSGDAQQPGATCGGSDQAEEEEEAKEFNPADEVPDQNLQADGAPAADSACPGIQPATAPTPPIPAVHTANVGAFEHDAAMNTTDGSSSAKSPIRYVAFDLRNSVDRAWNYMTCLAERECDHVGMFACTTQKARLQHGVVRSNCVDCIDRTNMAQFFFGLHALGKQLQHIGKLHSDVDLSQSPTVYNLVLHMYLLLGDSIAIQYGGSAQVGAGLLHRGLAWDKIMGIKRLYNNIMVDKDKQTVTNLFLGLYQPCQEAGPLPGTAPTGGGLMRLPPHRGVEKQIMAAANSAAAAASGDAAAATTLTRMHTETLRSFAGGISSRAFFQTPGKAYRVVDVSELESDYYLHVRGGPQKPTPYPRTWFKDAFARHQLRLEARLAGLVRTGGDGAVTASPVPRPGSKWVVLDDQGRVKQMWHDDLQRSIRAVWFTSHSMGNDSDDEAEPTPHAVSTLLVTNSTTSAASSARELSLTEGVADEQNRAPVQLCEMPRNVTYFETEPDYGNSCELTHNHRQFVDAVLTSRHAADRKAMERLCDTPIATSVLDVMKQACLLRFGPLMKWSIDTFLEALEELEPEIHPRVFVAIKRHHVDVVAVCRSSFEYIPDKKTLLTLLHFVKLLKHMPIPDEAGINHYLGGPSELSPLEFADENVAFPERSSSHLQQFFAHSLQPSSIQRDVRALLAEMAHPGRGVQAGDVVRFRDRHDESAIPEPVVMRRVFLISTLENWLLENSPRLGLSLHHAPEKSECSLNVSMFIRWLTQASILIKWEVPQAVSVGLTVGAVHVKELLSDSVVLFTLKQFLEPVVVEGAKAIVCTPQAPPSLFDHMLSAPNLASPAGKSSPLFPGGTASGVRPRTRHAEGVLVVPEAPVAVDSLAVAHMSASIASAAFSAFASYVDDESTSSHRNALLKFSEGYSTDLRRIDLALLADADVRTAFFINVFNVLFIHSWLLVSQRPSLDFFVFYATHGYVIGGHFFTLADLKHGVLRSNRPGPTCFLPQFLDDDPRLQLARNDRLLERKDLTLKIVLGLADTYLAPDKLTDIIPYDPKHFESGGYGRYKSAMSFIDVSNSSVIIGTNKQEITVTEDGFELVDRPPSDDSSGDEQSEKATLSPARSKQTTSMFFSSWFRSGKKTSAPIHYCLPLYGTMLWKQLESIEEKYVQAMGDPQQPQIQILGGPPYLRMLQPLIGLEEAGATAEEVVRALQAVKKKPARAKGTSMVASSESRRRQTFARSRQQRAHGDGDTGSPPAS